MITNRKSVAPPKLLLALSLVAIGVLGIALSVGSGLAGPMDLFDALGDAADPTTRDILLKLRLPRALAAFGTGATLALAGVLMQVLLRNPLADPYILGTSGGAAVAALLTMLAGAGAVLIDIAAFSGALASTLLVFLIARYHGDWAPGRLLLTGVVIAAGWGAVISLLLALSANTPLQGMLFWLMGDLGFAQTSFLGVLALALVDDQVGLFEHRQVAGNRGLGQVEVPDDLADRPLPSLEKPQDLLPGSVRERLEELGCVAVFPVGAQVQIHSFSNRRRHRSLLGSIGMKLMEQF